MSSGESSRTTSPTLSGPMPPASHRSGLPRLHLAGKLRRDALPRPARRVRRPCVGKDARAAVRAHGLDVGRPLHAHRLVVREGQGRALLGCSPLRGTGRRRPGPRRGAAQARRAAARHHHGHLQRRQIAQLPHSSRDARVSTRQRRTPARPRPAALAASASDRRVMPQIFTSGRPGRMRAHSRAQKSPARLRRRRRGAPACASGTSWPSPPPGRPRNPPSGPGGRLPVRRMPDSKSRRVFQSIQRPQAQRMQEVHA